jgi:tripartite-type tricarboxylate transporter receptor subunit TctC
VATAIRNRIIIEKNRRRTTRQGGDMRKIFYCAIAAAGVATGTIAPAWGADGAADFYRGKSIQVILASGAGGVYSIIVQLLGRYLPAHMPGAPALVPQYMPGAGGVKAANYLYNIAPRDGTAIGALFKDTAIFQVLRPKGVKYDASRFGWLPSWAESASSITVLRSAPATTIAAAKIKPVTIGAFGKGSGTYQVPALLNNTIGTKFKIVTGYSGGAAVRLAMERGEVDGFAGFLSSWQIVSPEWVRDHKLVHLVQIARKRAKEAPDVPLLTELAQTDEQRKIFSFVSATGPLANAFSTPPGVPADRMKALDKALWDTFHDPAFVKDAAAKRLDVDPVPASEVAEAVREIVSVPPSIAAAAKKALEME